jgi:hypothetical protein
LYRKHWGLDDLVLMSFMLCVSLMVFSFRRLQDLSKEVKGRAAAEHGEAPDDDADDKEHRKKKKRHKDKDKHKK